MYRPQLPHYLPVRLRAAIAALFLSMSGAAQAQERIPIPPAGPKPLPVRESIAGGEVRFVPITDRDDAIPLPGEIQHVEGPNGVQEIQPKGTNPYVLGFVAGEYAPPVQERVDPILRQTAQALPPSRANGVTYGFAMFSKRMTAKRIALLESMGARFLGMHPHYTAKLAMPAHAIDAIADLDFIRWVGVPRPWQKIQPRLALAAANAEAQEELEVWINVYESDMCDASTFEYVGEASEVRPGFSVPLALPVERGAKLWRSNGWQQEALEAAGMELRSYSDSIKAFRARLTAAEVATVRNLDFVQFIELQEDRTLFNEESMPMCGVDLTRPTNTGSTFGDVVVGQVDSGYQLSHQALDHVWAWGWNFAGSGSTWTDETGHGSHVAGTILGKGTSGNEALNGVVPNLGSSSERRYYNIKIFDENGNDSGTSYETIFSKMHNTAGGSIHPHIVNNSYGVPSSSSPWIGSEASARLIDNEVYSFGQLYVFSSGNGGPSLSTLTKEGAAKNAFTVGAVSPNFDSTSSGVPGDICTSSSRGPCGDGRWKPNIVAPGSDITSVDSFTSNGYTVKSGTSMAAPHVSGIAAQLVDRWDFLQYNAPTLSAMLMGSALGQDLLGVHTAPTDSDLDQYGAGRVSANRAINGDGVTILLAWGYIQSHSAHGEVDFLVGPGATRLTVVMTYHEPGASAGASKALVQDIDTYIDREPFGTTGNSGDYSFQISHIDNTEIRSINNPTAGNYRVKTWPTSVTSGWFKPRVGICVVVDYGDVPPHANLAITSSKQFVKPNETVEIDVSVTNQSDGYIAQSVCADSFMHGMNLDSVRTYLADGSVSELVDNANGGHVVMLGDMRHGQTRSATWEGSWATEGVKSCNVNTISPTLFGTSGGVEVTVDGTSPGQPMNLNSPSHPANGSSCDTLVTMEWDAASDALSGIAGYSYVWNQQMGSTPDVSVDTTSTTVTAQLSVSPQGWWFHVRGVDKAGNAGNVAHIGPFFFGEAQVTSYCNSNLNSTGQMGLLDTFGPVCLSDGALTLQTTNLPTNQAGYYLFSPAKGNAPFFGGSQGVLCVGAPIVRWINDVLNSGATGVMTFSPDLANLPQDMVFTHGSTWNFQLWYRDQNPGSTSNTSNGIEVIWD